MVGMNLMIFATFVLVLYVNSHFFYYFKTDLVEEFSEIRLFPPALSERER